MGEAFRGSLFRAINPVHARDPLSGRGAALYGGRFNARGVPALYLSLSVMTALKEANRVGSLQPTTLVAYDADIEGLFDCRDEAALAAEGMDCASLADPAWRERMRKDGEAPTQRFARRLADTGRTGLIVGSFAPGARADDLNLVLWTWGDRKPVRLSPIDDEGRLSR